MSQTTPPILPEPTLRRLPWYLAYVERLLAQGIDHVSSTSISKALNVDASRIAKDLSFLNLKGKTRIGYEVKALAESLSDFLGFKAEHKAVVFGAGNLGRALILDKGLANYGLQLVGAVDIDPAIAGMVVEGVEIFAPSSLPMLMQKEKPAVAILTVPAEVAQEVADSAIKAGFTAIWNFSPYRVKVPDHIALANTSIYAHLALIYNRLAAAPVKN
ncbi:MAG: redox-sensing transcriptional repressor Rex [Bacteroides sp.]|nr:redox-sensing transcriptional repressor Rex [Bacteroidales bacterium]MBD5295501.1 redox-sensing transcriptional repressor Rex [Bacteroides sp.]MDE6235135.1 redox-sensing transcriptional repressor Rex [Muribaculaceae bacterium]